MIVYRYQSIMQVLTEPTNLATSAQRIGGWSESFWSQNAPGNQMNAFSNLQTLRAVLLPQSGTITGFRITTVNVTGNKQMAGGSLNGGLNVVGGTLAVNDIPQMAVQCQGAISAGANKTTFWIRGIPDAQVVGGEISFSTGYTAAMLGYTRALQGSGWGFVGRDLSQGLISINNYISTTSTLTLSAAVPGLSAGGYVRFHRCIDSTGKSVKGTYLVTSVAGPTLVLANGPPNSVLVPNGTVRLDVLAFFPFATVKWLRAGIKKVGRPFLLYRGRRAKRR